MCVILERVWLDKCVSQSIGLLSILGAIYHEENDLNLNCNLLKVISDFIFELCFSCESFQRDRLQANAADLLRINGLFPLYLGI